MAPPTYADLGKAARDVFGKGFHFGLVKLDVKTKTGAGLEVNSSGQSNTDSGKVSGSLELKHKCTLSGLNLNTKWNTDNLVTGSISAQDQLVPGLKVTLDSSLSPDTAALAGKLGAELCSEALRLAMDTDLSLTGPLLTSSAVAAHRGWLSGWQGVFDTSKSKLVKNNLALGYAIGDFALHCNVNDGQIFGASLYQKVNSNIETGVNLGWTASSSTTSFGVAVKYTVDKTSCFRAKINNSSQIGLGATQQIRPGLALTLSTLVDGKNFNQGGHKVGLALELES